MNGGRWIANTFGDLAFGNDEIAAYESPIVMAEACSATNAEGFLHVEEITRE